MGVISRQKPNHRVAVIIETVTMQCVSLIVLCVISGTLDFSRSLNECHACIRTFFSTRHRAMISHV